MKLANGMDFELSINEHDVPLSQFASPMMQIDESDEFGIPILMMALVDNTGGGIIKQYTPIPDGALVSVTIGTGNAVTTREFRASGCKGDGATLYIRGYLNHPKYVVESSDEVMYETSKDALERIANVCGFDFSCPITADRNRWACTNQRYVNLARYVLDRAYISDDSMMAGIIRLDGQMRIRNLAVAQPSVGLFGYAPGAVPIYGFKPEPMSTQNMHGGYKQVVVQSDMFGKNNSLDSMDLTVTERSLNRNPKLADMSGAGAVKYLPPTHPRNSHQNFARAQYNNKRFLDLFSMRGTMLLANMFSTVDGLDTITLSAANSADGTGEGQLAVSFDGDWVVRSKSIYVDNGQYFERFNLMRMGLDVDMHSNTV